MESKICTYTSHNIRLQLVRICEDHKLDVYEIRLNRKVIDRFEGALGMFARFYFLHAVHELCINRSISLLNLTS